MSYHDYPLEYTQVFDEQKSKKHAEQDVLMTGLGVARVKPEGTGVTYDDTDEGWVKTYKHVETALAVRITKVAIEDNLYEALVPKFGRGLARAVRESCEIRGAAVFNNAGNAGSWAGGDGVALLSASHPRQDGGTFSNVLGTPADLSETSLEDVLIMIRTAKDDRGLPIMLRPKGLVISPYLQFDAHRILKTELRPGTDHNDINAIRSMGLMSAPPKVLTRMVDPDAWFVQTDAEDGLKCFVRRPTTRSMEGDFETDDMRYKVTRRDSFGFTDPRCLFGSEGAG
ncbi:MAG: Mu-like prophage major head subunit gpT family protein [Thiohalocapsa sp.]